MNPIFYRKIQVDGLSIFYREAGPKNAGTLLLLHGLPSSSRMFEPLFARLSDRYHLIAPDYPGFGHSDWPDPRKFAYTFDHLAETMDHFTEALGLSRYTLYMQDYGGPVGFRMALEHPERTEALIVQDAVAHNEGLGANWKTRRAFWADRTANESALRTNLLSLEAARARHVGNDPDSERHNPDLWTDEFYFLNRPGQAARFAATSAILTVTLSRSDRALPSATVNSRPGKSTLTVPGELSAMRNLTSPVRKLSALETKRPQVLNHRCETLSWTSLKDMVARDGVEPATPAFLVLRYAAF